MATAQNTAQTGYLYEEEVVRAVKPRAVKVKGSLVMMVLVIFLTGLAVAYYYSQLYTLNYQMDTLQNQINTLAASTQNLDASISRYSSLDYVEQVATTRLGMVKPSGQRLTVSIAPFAPSGSVSTENTPSRQPEKQVFAERNPVLDTFYQMVSRFEQKIKNG